MVFSILTGSGPYVVIDKRTKASENAQEMSSDNGKVPINEFLLIAPIEYLYYLLNLGISPSDEEIINFRQKILEGNTIPWAGTWT